jgi:hypothetical protein
MGWFTRLTEMANSVWGLKDPVAYQRALAWLTASEQAVAAEGTLVGGAGATAGAAATIMLPVVSMAGVFVLLGGGYYQAREQAKEEGYASGFAKGFITGLLKWEVRFTMERFVDKAGGWQAAFDEMVPILRAKAHNMGLMLGHMAGFAKNDQAKKTHLLGLHKLTTTSKAGWLPRYDDEAERLRARLVQITYVIELAAAARKHGLIKQE